MRMPLVESEHRKSNLLAILAGYPVAAAVGLAAFRVGAWTIFQNGPGLTDKGVPFLAHAVQAITMIVIMVLDGRLAYSERAFVRALGVAAATGTAATVLVLAPVPLAAYAGSALHGAASAFVLVGAGVCFCSLRPNQSCFALCLAFAVYGLVTWALSFLPAPAIVAVSIACYPIAFFCLYVDIGKGRVLERASAAASEARRGGVPWSMLLLLGLCTLASIMARVLVPMTEELLSSSYRAYWPMMLIGIFVLCCLWILVLKKDSENIWPLFMMIIFSGFLFFSSFSRDDPLFAASFFRATRECLMLFCWVVIAGSASSRNLPRLPYFAATTLVFLSGPVIVTSAWELFVPERSFSTPGPEAILATTAMSLVLVVATVAVAFGKTVSSRASMQDARGVPGPVPTVEDALSFVSSRFDLTPREAEVASLLVKGYTLPHAAEALCLSIDTVRTHSKSLYRKLGIHKKRELIALVEQTRSS